MEPFRLLPGKLDDRGSRGGGSCCEGSLEALEGSDGFFEGSVGTLEGSGGSLGGSWAACRAFKRILCCCTAFFRGPSRIPAKQWHEGER